MPNADGLAARMAERIRASSHTLTVSYPPAKVVPTGTSQTTAPVSPLTGPKPTHLVVESAPTPVQADVTMPCLWLDAGQLGDLRRPTMTVSDYGWMAGADACARVLATDADEGRVFLGTAVVTHGVKRYKVLAVVPVGPSFAPAATYAVWLKGSLV